MGPTSAATGSNVDMPVLLRNGGSRDCVVEGFADITVLDDHGGALAVASGSTGKGTYFNDGPAVPILVRAGGRDAFMNLTWYDCKHPQAAQLAVDLPAQGGRVVVPFAVAGRYYMVCDDNPAYSALARGPFSPVGIQWPPGPSYIPVRIAIDAPASAKKGSTLEYFVTIRNEGPADYRLDPCPDYVAILGTKEAIGTYGLNCGPVGHIAPGSSVRSEMRLKLPLSVAAGPKRLEWGLLDARINPSHTNSEIAVT